jgi:hypothetical protein
MKLEIVIETQPKDIKKDIICVPILSLPSLLAIQKIGPVATP